MTKRTAGALFCCLAVLLFLSRYVFALWYLAVGRPGLSGADVFHDYLRYVGIAHWVLAAAFLIAGILYLVRSERET